MASQSLLKSCPTRPAAESSLVDPRTYFLNIIQLNFNLTTLLLIGASFQALLVLILPLSFAITPVILLLALRTIDTLLITYGPKKNPYLEGVLPRKAAAQVLDRNGQFTEPGQEKVAILLLGAKVNHPLGIFAPDFQKVSEYMMGMVANLEQNGEDTGFLGQSGYNSRDPRCANQLMFISYWRSLDDVHNYANGPLHKETVKWWDSTIKQHDHIGFMHEVFEADKGHWENLYINFQPTGMGATTYLRKGDKLQGGEVPDEWVSPLVDANKGKLRTGRGRLGRGDALSI